MDRQRDGFAAVADKIGYAVTEAFIPSPSANGFHVGPLQVHVYGLMYVLGGSRGDRDHASSLAQAGRRPGPLLRGRDVGVPGRADRRPDLLPDHDPEPDPPALVGAVRDLEGRPGDLGRDRRRRRAGLWCFSRADADVRRFMDAAAPGLLVAQAFGRVGNYFNQELFGGPTTLPWGLKIDPAHRPPHYTQYVTFHPTFLYEIIWNLLLAAFLVWLGHHRRIRPPGLFALYVAGYSGFRVFEETLRVDYSNHIFGLRLNFFVASILCILGLLWFVAIQREWRMPSWFPRRSTRPPAPTKRPAGKRPPRTRAQRRA